MTSQGATAQRRKLQEYDELYQYREKLYEALKELTADDPTGPCGKGPFTGNTRESRRVVSIGLSFSPTRGHSPAVQTAFDFPDYVFEAYQFGLFLTDKLRTRIAEITKQIEAL